MLVALAGVVGGVAGASSGGAVRGVGSGSTVGGLTCARWRDDRVVWLMFAQSARRAAGSRVLCQPGFITATLIRYCHRQLLDDRSDMDQRTRPETPNAIRLNMLNDTTRDAVLVWWQHVGWDGESVTLRSFVRVVSRELGERHVWLADSAVRDLWNFLYPQYAETTTEGIDK